MPSTASAVWSAFPAQMSLGNVMSCDSDVFMCRVPVMMWPGRYDWCQRPDLTSDPTMQRRRCVAAQSHKWNRAVVRAWRASAVNRWNLRQSWIYADSCIDTPITHNRIIYYRPLTRCLPVPARLSVRLSISLFISLCVCWSWLPSWSCIYRRACCKQLCLFVMQLWLHF